jgi:hypothetical protein
MPLTVFGITIQLGWLYAGECLRYNHSTRMVMALNVFNLDDYDDDCFGITIQLAWLCR